MSSHLHNFMVRRTNRDEPSRKLREAVELDEGAYAMRKSVIVIAALLASGAVAAPAAAESIAVAVSYADLDLSSPAGATALKHRIAAAAERVCQKPHIRDLKAMERWQACKVAARADAVERLTAHETPKGRLLATLF